MSTQVKIIESTTPEIFDVHATHPMQSYAWGEAKKSTGVRVVRIGEYEGEKLVAVFQMTVHKVPKLPYYIGYIPRSGVPSQSVVDFVRNYARSIHCVFVKWETYVPAIDADSALLSLGMKKSSHPLFTKWNQELDLQKTEQELLSQCHEKTRYSIRLAGRKGVTVKEMSTDEGFEIFCKLYFDTCKRQKYHGHTRAYHEIIWNNLGKQGVARIFIAFYNGEPKAAYELFFFHDRAYYTYGGTSNTDRNIPSAQLLMWTTILEAKKAGLTTYDMWGSLAPDFTGKHPWNGFTYFKRGFGTNFVEMSSSFDQVFNPTIYMIYGLAYALRKLIFRSGIF